MDQKSVYKKSAKIVARVIGEETVLLPLFKTSDDINSIYTLNRAASWVWEQMDGCRSLGAIREEAQKKFDVTPQNFDRQIRQVLKDLQEVGALVKAR